MNSGCSFSLVHFPPDLMIEAGLLSRLAFPVETLAFNVGVGAHFSQLDRGQRFNTDGATTVRCTTLRLFGVVVTSSVLNARPSMPSKARCFAKTNENLRHAALQGYT
jgi:hypothetical protein